MIFKFKYYGIEKYTYLTSIYIYIHIFIIFQIKTVKFMKQLKKKNKKQKNQHINRMPISRGHYYGKLFEIKIKLYLHNLIKDLQDMN